MRRQALARLALVGLVMSAPARAGSEVPTPPASLEDIPSAKPKDVTRLLRKVRQRHGEDAAVIQTLLLLNAMQQGSVLAIGVRVDRVEKAFGKHYLGFILETGLVFDDSTRDRLARVQILWTTIMEPTLARLQDGLQVQADGIMVQMQYYHRPYSSIGELRTDIKRPGTSEEARFYVLKADIDAVLHGELTLRTLLRRVRTTIDGVEVAVDSPREDSLLTPGPE